MNQSFEGRQTEGMTPETHYTSEKGSMEANAEYPSSISSDLQLDDQESRRVGEKADAIRQACDLRDLDALVSHATSEGGFLHDELRQLAWPILLQYDKGSPDHGLSAIDDLPPHGDEEQVQLDVNRSFVYYPECSEDELSSKKSNLSKVIKQVLRNYPMLCYFQGYHDIAQVLLLVLGDKESVPAVARISLFRIRDYMLPSLSPALRHLQIIPAIIEKADPTICHHLEGIRPFFALAATLTLYAHDIQEYSDIARLFDFILAWEPVVSIYLFAAIILSRKKELLEISVDEPEMLHFTLSKLPCPLDLDGLISQAVQLFRDLPPDSLPSGVWRNIPSCSVLKTSRDIFNGQPMDTAKKYFEEQKRRLRNEERREKIVGFLWSHRRTIGSVAIAVAIGAISIWIRKKGFDSTILSYFDRFRATFQAQRHV